MLTNNNQLCLPNTHKIIDFSTKPREKIVALIVTWMCLGGLLVNES